MRLSNIAYLVLASGLSERFGLEDKMMANLEGRALIDHVLDMSASAGFGKGFIVSREGAFRDLKVIRNIHPDKGQGHALRLGLAAIENEGWEAACILLGDMPLIEASHIMKMVQKVTPGQSVVSISGNQKMPPAIFNRQAISKILEGTSVLGAKSIFSQINHLTVRMAPAQAMDVDRKEDLKRIEVLMKANQKTDD